MPTRQCRDRIRFRLSDDSGALRFEAFAIVNATECGDMERTLREYLVGRKLVDVDLAYLRSLKCPLNGACLFAMLEVVEQHQRLFSAKAE